MSDKKKPISNEELEQVQGGHPQGGAHDHPGRDPVPQQRRQGFGKVQMGGGELGEGELRQIKGGSAIPMAGGEATRRTGRDLEGDRPDVEPPFPGMNPDGSDIEKGPNPLGPSQ